MRTYASRAGGGGWQTQKSKWCRILSINSPREQVLSHVKRVDGGGRAGGGEGNRAFPNVLGGFYTGITRASHGHQGKTHVEMKIVILLKDIQHPHFLFD